MYNPGQPSKENNYPDTTPAKRIRAARRDLDRHLWFLKKHIQCLAKQVKEAQKAPADERSNWPSRSLERAIEETKLLMLQRGGEMFRALGEIRLAVAAHQAEKSEAEAARGCQKKEPPQK
jgi:predicted acylesterase/phospholipase RssA